MVRKGVRYYETVDSAASRKSDNGDKLFAHNSAACHWICGIIFRTRISFMRQLILWFLALEAPKFFDCDTLDKTFFYK